MASGEENSDTIALHDNILIQDVISLIQKNGINSCVDEICTKMSNLTEHKSCVEKDLKAKLAKYKNLNKKKDHPSAAKILKQFLDTPYIGPENILDSGAPQKESGKHSQEMARTFKPIGYMESVFHFKNGTPRQSGICKSASGKVKIHKGVFNNPEHSLEGLQEFSHVWVLFWFHKNNNAHTKAKVKPPRLNGATTGVFSTRSPYRPNPIGLSLASLDKVDGDTIYLSGIDILDGTPILDIKPYISQYDQPETSSVKRKYDSLTSSESEVDTKSDGSQSYECKSDSVESKLEFHASQDCEAKIRKIDTDVCLKSDQVPSDRLLHKTSDKAVAHASTSAEWISNPPIHKLDVSFTNKAEEQIQKFSADSPIDDFKLKYIPNGRELKSAIVDILQADPRSTYRRKHCGDKLYYFTLDTVHVTCWFGEEGVEVVKVKALAHVEDKILHKCSQSQVPVSVSDS